MSDFEQDTESAGKRGPLEVFMDLIIKKNRISLPCISYDNFDFFFLALRLTSKQLHTIELYLIIYIFFNLNCLGSTSTSFAIYW